MVVQARIGLLFLALFTFLPTAYLHGQWIPHRGSSVPRRGGIRPFRFVRPFLHPRCALRTRPMQRTAWAGSGCSAANSLKAAMTSGVSSGRRGMGLDQWRGRVRTTQGATACEGLPAPTDGRHVDMRLPCGVMRKGTSGSSVVVGPVRS